MQELIRFLPVVIYEYVIETDGNRFFKYVSENAKQILGLDAQQLISDVTAKKI